eukprot:TRINITY_DN13327_c0_g1_i1.p1 TRINITY_DN13327_c0_g1~~TRINITY_DN13327_c0_g1_i1.p1  ORF type:complete len:479 (+),score=99.24 TRINITY_DN13327_c0_g1_i1:195-1439(+)
MVKTEKTEVEQPQRWVLFVMVGMIQGYTLIGPLQHTLKVAIHIADTGAVAHAFTQAAALVQWGKFFMTLAQNFILAPLLPVQRVYLALALMMLGTLVPPVFVYAAGSTWLGWVFFTFGFIGFSLGIFEANFLTVITPLGPLTKSWAIMGYPAAFAGINVIGMSLVSLGMPVQVLFWYIALCVPLAAGLFYFMGQAAAGKNEAGTEIQQSSDQDSGDQQSTVWKSLLEWRVWFIRLLPFVIVNFVSHFVMEGALPASFNTYNAKLAPLFGRSDSTYLMNKDCYFVIFFVFVGLGDIVSRRVGYMVTTRTFTSNMLALLFGLLCCVLGLCLMLLGIGVVSWVAALLAFFGNGWNYAVSAKFIDRFIPREHHLVGYSFWMFVGAAGAIAGSTMVDVIREWICHGESYAHECLSHHHR